MPMNRPNTIDRRRLLAALVTVVIFAAASVIAFAQGGATRYVYDDNGRLRAVIAPNGEANVYEYDAAGNITAIRRNAAGTLEILDFSPREGVPGNQVTIVGTGFGAGVSAVAFNGAAAQIVSSSATVLVVTVPNGATTGPIGVTTPGGTVATARPFTVRGISVTPSAITVLSGQSIQFAAAVVLTGDPSVVWSVDGIEGGNPLGGTITAAGFYTAPVLLPNQPSVVSRIRATSVAEPELVGEAQVRVLNPENARAVSGASVTVRLLPPAGVLLVSPSSAGVTVRLRPPAGVLPASPIGAGVTVRLSAPAGVFPASPISNGVTVRLSPPTGVLPVSPFGPGVTVRLSPPAGVRPAAPFSPGVTVTAGPNVSTVSPGSLTRGTSAPIAVNGVNLGGATAIRFVDGAGAVDPDITFSGLSVNGGGTSLTATVSVGAGAALGSRIVVVLSPNAHSQTGNTGSNTIQIVQ